MHSQTKDCSNRLTNQTDLRFHQHPIISQTDVDQGHLLGLPIADGQSHHLARQNGDANPIPQINNLSRCRVVEVGQHHHVEVQAQAHVAEARRTAVEVVVAVPVVSLVMMVKVSRRLSQRNISLHQNPIHCHHNHRNPPNH